MLSSLNYNLSYSSRNTLFKNLIGLESKNSSGGGKEGDSATIYKMSKNLVDYIIWSI